MIEEETRPRIAYSRGPLPLHVRSISGSEGSVRHIDLMESRGLRAWFNTPRTLHCADEAQYQLRLEQLVAARIPFMIGHMVEGPSDSIWHWQREHEVPVNYLEIALGGQQEWFVREITDATESWSDRLGLWKKTRLRDLQLGPDAALQALLTPLPKPVPPRGMPSPAPVEPATPRTLAPTAAVAPRPTTASIAPAKGPPSIDGPAVPASAPLACPPPVANPPQALKWRRFAQWASSSAVVENTAHALLYLCLAWAVYLGIQSSHIHMLDSDFPGLAWAALPWAVGSATVYSAAWLMLCPRAFTGFGKRFHICAAALVVAIITALALLLRINVRYDMAPQGTVHSRIVSKRIGKGKNRNPASWSYGLIVKPWQPDRLEEHLFVSHALFDRVKPGDRIRFKLHPGRLGWAWYTWAEADDPNFLGTGVGMGR